MNLRLAGQRRRVGSRRIRLSVEPLELRCVLSAFAAGEAPLSINPWSGVALAEAADRAAADHFAPYQDHDRFGDGSLRGHDSHYAAGGLYDLRAHDERPGHFYDGFGSDGREFGPVLHSPGAAYQAPQPIHLNFAIGQALLSIEAELYRRPSTTMIVFDFGSAQAAPPAKAPAAALPQTVVPAVADSPLGFDAVGESGAALHALGAPAIAVATDATFANSLASRPEARNLAASADEGGLVVLAPSALPGPSRDSVLASTPGLAWSRAVSADGVRSDGLVAPGSHASGKRESVDEQMPLDLPGLDAAVASDPADAEILLDELTEGAEPIVEHAAATDAVFDRVWAGDAEEGGMIALAAVALPAADALPADDALRSDAVLALAGSGQQDPSARSDRECIPMNPAVGLFQAFEIATQPDDSADDSVLPPAQLPSQADSAASPASDDVSAARESASRRAESPGVRSSNAAIASIFAAFGSVTAVARTRAANRTRRSAEAPQAESTPEIASQKRWRGRRPRHNLDRGET